MTHFPMTIFYISIYLIITVLLNDAIKFCSKIPLSDDSCRTEICRTCRSMCDGSFYWCHYRTDNTGCFKKSRLTLNLIFQKNIAGHITLNCYFHNILLVAAYSEQLRINEVIWELANEQ